MTVILGIDPGSRVTGFGVIEFKNDSFRCLAEGCIHTGDGPFADRLHAIYHGLSDVIIQHKPNECAIEEVFMHRNVSAALKLGHARGAAMVSAATRGLTVSEYAARQVKQAVVGYGAADKTQVQHMIRVILQLKYTPQSDASDALAVAICHAHTGQGLKRRGFR